MSIIHYLHRSYDWRSKALTEAYDELPLWSAAPGNLLLENLPYDQAKTILDIGCGTGFPLLLLARRFGPDCRVIGVDPWEAAMDRTAAKIKAWGLENVELIRGEASKIPLPDGSIDLITSNLGLNNFDDVAGVLAECRRLLAPEGRLCLSTNLRGTFKEFYTTFRAATRGDIDLQQKITAQEHHRQTVESLEERLNQSGFGVERTVQAIATMTYASGTSFLNDYFIVMGFLPSWKAVVPEGQWEAVFADVEARLNAVAARKGRLRLTVPLAYVELRQQRS